MGHNVCAIVISGAFDSVAADSYGLRPILTHGPHAVLPIDHYFTTYWATRLGISGHLSLSARLPVTFPADRVIVQLVAAVCAVAAPRFAIIMTEYCGGNGAQWAVVLEGEQLLFSGNINGALARLGVRRSKFDDEFETVGLSKIRANPDYLDEYMALCDELGI